MVSSSGAHYLKVAGSNPAPATKKEIVMAKKTGTHIPSALTSSKKKNQSLRRTRHKKKEK